MSQDPKRFGIVSDRIHGTGVFTYMYHKFQTHEGKHTMHVSYGCLFPISKICKYLSWHLTQEPASRWYFWERNCAWTLDDPMWISYQPFAKRCLPKKNIVPKVPRNIEKQCDEMVILGICAMVKSRYIGDGHPNFNRNPYNGYKPLRTWVEFPIPYYMEISWELRPFHHIYVG